MLETDAVNLAETRALAARQAARFYARLLGHGLPAWCARQAAISYLRRKTQWPRMYAAGVLDATLAADGNP